MFLAGSDPGVIVIFAGVTVLSTVRIALFHTPSTLLGAKPVPPCCQSPTRLASPLTVRSVMKRAGHNGRPPPSAVSLPEWSPLGSVQPTCGWTTVVGNAGVGVIAQA